MKRSIYWINLFTVVLILTLGAAGCKKKAKGPTPIPGSRPGVTGQDGGFPSEAGRVPPNLTDNTGARPLPLDQNPDGTRPLEGRLDLSKTDQDRGPLAAYTVHFDYDRAAVKSSETSKLESVASYLKSNPGVGVQVEGHCDQRGTEQYNLSLGERRALALREYLVNLGIETDRVLTISYGEDKPADLGNNEAAWAKNRRGEFVVLRPKQ
jgi:peptidoglycan-associated lipoprotein